VSSDGQKITREVSLAMVTDGDQAAQIAAYKAWASRVSLTVSGEYKLHAMRYQEGECITLTSLRAGIIAKKMRIVNMSINPALWTVSVVMIEELDARHADALSKTTTPPPIGDFNITGDIQSPIPAEWTLLTDHDGGIAVIDATGNLTNIASLTAIAVYYRLSTDTDWTLQVSGPVFTPFTAVVPELPRGTDYDIGVQYIRGPQASPIIEVGSIETA
jgi:hypothetical protein